MAIEAGRVGVRADQVDPYGRVKGGGGGTDPAVEKLEEQVGSYSFRTNPEDGSAQYRQSDESEWENFSAGGGGATLLWENEAPTNRFSDTSIQFDKSGYSHLLLVARQATGDDYTKEFCALVENELNTMGGFYIIAPINFGEAIGGRPFKVTSNGIESQYSVALSNNSTIHSNSGWCIPTKIYGINLTI